MKQNTNTSKDKEIMDYLDEKIFNDALNADIKAINTRISLTRARMLNLSASSKIQYFNSAITKGSDTYMLLRDNSLTTFEDIADEFNDKFNEDWLEK